MLLINRHLTDQLGVIANAAFVLGLTAGRLLPDATFGAEVLDGDGCKHAYLTRIAHWVRKATPTKLRTLRNTFVEIPGVEVVDYPEDAAPSDYAVYAEKLGNHSGKEIAYRAVYVYGSAEKVVPLTRNLSRL